MTTDNPVSSDNEPTDAFNREVEQWLALLKQKPPHVEAFSRQMERAVGKGNLAQLQALLIHAFDDNLLSGLTPEILNRPIYQRNTLFLNAIHASRDGVPLPLEQRSELLYTLMQAGALPLKYKNENPLKLLVDQNFPEDILRMANDALVSHLGLKEGSIIAELKPRLAHNWKKPIPMQTHWTVRTAPHSIHDDPKAALRRC